jgi:hypothetical protein
MSYTYPATHQPSAVYYSPPPMEDGAGLKGMPNLSEECPICYDDFRTHATGDQRTFRQLAKTECNHFFHQFCLNQYLTHGMNTSCPMCRKTAVTYTTINLDPVPQQAPKPPVVQPQASNVDQNNEQNWEFPVGEAVNMGGSLLYGLGSLALGTVRVAGSILYHGASAVASALTETKQQFDQRVQNLFQKSEKAMINFQTIQRRNQEDIAMLTATVKSMPEDKLHKARSSFDRVEAAYAEFERSLLNNQNRLNAVISEELKELAR